MVVDTIRRQSQGAARGLAQSARAAAVEQQRQQQPAAVELAPPEEGSTAGQTHAFDIADLHFVQYAGEGVLLGEATLFDAE